MSFKKNFFNKAQSTFEYLVLAGIILSLTLLSVTQFLPRIRENLDKNFFQKAVAKILGEGEAVIPEPPGPEPPGPGPEPEQ